MTLDLLVSCMNMNDFSIIEKSNIQSNSIIVNQCDEDKICSKQFLDDDGHEYHAMMICSPERGVSRSRNMALRNSCADICLFVDDDEHFVKNYDKAIIEAFESHPDLDIIIFRVTNKGVTYKETPYVLNKYDSAHVWAWQIAFRRKKVIERNIWFDEKMGSGSGNGGGEENKFIYQCICSGLKAMYLPITIGSVDQISSQWSHGISKKWFEDIGWVFRRIYGSLWGYIFIWYHIIKHCRTIYQSFSLWSIIKYIHIGFFDKR